MVNLNKSSMRKTAVLLGIITVILIFSGGCYYDKETDLYPFGSLCDTTNVTYSQTISGIMATNCNTCHNSSLASGNVITDTYAGLSVVALNGKLYGTVNWSPGFNAMPKGGTKLSDCDIAKIRTWINSGAQNN